ncbi:MAG: hypothetical protein MUF71_15025 [Candidatus Kapabacteria bacterium]|jgi:hypothetical protein|nr:hypothetical protein [Candidatus Kapabacteria bacterium]
MDSDFLYLKEIIETAQYHNILSDTARYILLGQITWAYRRDDISLDQVHILYALAGINIHQKEIVEALEIATFGDVEHA